MSDDEDFEPEVASGATVVSDKWAGEDEEDVKVRNVGDFFYFTGTRLRFTGLVECWDLNIQLYLLQQQAWAKCIPIHKYWNTFLKEILLSYPCSSVTQVRNLPQKLLRAVNIDTETNGKNTNNDEVQLYQEILL